MNNIGNVDELIKQEKIEKEKQKKFEEDMLLACKEIFKDDNALFFLKHLKKMCLWDEVDNNINNEILIYKKARRDVWLLLRQYLPRDILIELEIERKN